MTTTFRRLAWLLPALLLAAALPSAALAAPRDDSCAAYGSFTYALAVPAGFRTPGLHHFQWHNTFLDEDGNPQAFDSDNEIEVASGAPLYGGQMLLRLGNNAAMLPSGEVDPDIQAMNPQQRATFYVVTGFPRGLPNADTDAMALRWEGAPGVWSDWITVPRSPQRSFCEEVNVPARFVRSHGWSIG